MALATPRLVELVTELVRIPSTTGHEHAIADFVAAFLAELGLDVERLPVDEAGDTVVGTLAGAGEGPTMMLNFHLVCPRRHPTSAAGGHPAPDPAAAAVTTGHLRRLRGLGDAALRARADGGPAHGPRRPRHEGRRGLRAGRD